MGHRAEEPQASQVELPLKLASGLPVPAMVSRISDDLVLLVNSEFTLRYGLTQTAVEGQTACQLYFTSSDREEALSRFRQGQSESVEVRIRDAAGGFRWAESRIGAFVNSGNPVYLTLLHDVSDRKRIESELEQVARFPQMNPGPVARVTLDGTISMANEAARSLFRREVLEGECLWDLMPAIDESVRERVMEATDPVRLDASVGDMWFRLTLTPDFGRDEIFVFGTDVTAQKVAEQDVAERARFPELNPGPVARLEHDGTVIRANPAASRIFGRESLTGAQWRDLCPGLGDEAWNGVFETGAVVSHEEDVGEKCFSFTLRHEPGLHQVFVYGADATEMKFIQRALAELARFPELNPGPVCRLDRSGDILLANPAALEVFGSEDLVGQSWLDLCPGLNRVVWQRILDSTEPLPIEVEIARRHYLMTHARGPEGVFVFVYGSDITQEKQAEVALRQTEKMATLGTLAAGVAHELNNPAAAVQRASEQLETALGHLQRIQVELGAMELTDEASGLVNELLAQARDQSDQTAVMDPLDRADLESDLEEWLEGEGVEDPWEIASRLARLGYDRSRIESLTAALGHRQAGLAAAMQGQASRVYALLEEIRHGSSRLSEIVGAMKAYSYLGQGPVQRVDVNEGLRNTLVILRSKLKRGVQIIEELDPDIPLIEAYGGELNQVWTNLIDNAVDAMSGTGCLLLRTGVRGDRIAVEVEDDGPGIPSDIQDRIYDAFFTTKPPGKGTGLGLNTVYNIVVKKHHGSVDLTSIPGRTRFVVHLPIRHDAVASAVDREVSTGLA